MRFLVDTQLPRSLSGWLRQKGHHAYHIAELYGSNAIGDATLKWYADSYHYIILSKSSGFFDNHMLSGSPRKLLLLKTGPMAHADLLQLLAKQLPSLQTLFSQHKVIELYASNLIAYD